MPIPSRCCARRASTSPRASRSPSLRRSASWFEGRAERTLGEESETHAEYDTDAIGIGTRGRRARLNGGARLNAARLVIHARVAEAEGTRPPQVKPGAVCPSPAAVPCVILCRLGKRSDYCRRDSHRNE